MLPPLRSLRVSRHETPLLSAITPPIQRNPFPDHFLRLPPLVKEEQITLPAMRNDFETHLRLPLTVQVI